MAEPIIQIENVVVSYRDSVALRGVSLAVPRGEFLGIIGPNGAGKTTLLTVVNGLSQVLQGSVKVLGRDAHGRARHELRKQVGYVAQALAIDKRMPISTREVVMIGRYGRLGLFHHPGRHDSQLVDEALEMVGMAHLARRPIGHLSGGEQQRVAIARCLAQEPEIFLLDEPTASLDWKAQTEILELVKRIHQERGLTTLFVTHNFDALPHAFDRVVMLKDGLITGDGPPDKVISTESLSLLYNLPVAAVEERRPHIHTGGASMDFSIFGYQFMQNAILAALLGGITCGIIGVFVVLLHMPFIGVAMSHAAFAGALFGLWLGFNPVIGAFIFCLGAAAVIGPLADRGQLSPETSLGVIFSLMLGIAFLFIGIIPNTRSAALDLLWGSILANTRGDIIVLGGVAVLVVGIVILFFKEIQATVFQRDIARAVGIPATLMFYSILFLTGATITASFSSIGGLLIFSLILNPAAAAYQLTYNMKRMFILSAGFGVLSGWMGLLFSYLFDIPSGATIVVTSSIIFLLAVIFSPKRKVKSWQKKALPGDLR